MKDLNPVEVSQGFHADGLWHGRPKHCCNFCAWDTIVPERMVGHLEQVHHFKAAALKVEVEVSRSLSVPLYDSSGKLIQAVSEKRLI